MKKKTAILLVGAFVFTAAFSGCGKNKEAVADFQKGNMRLGLALTLVKEELK